MHEARFPVHTDDRGDLVAVEGADVGFSVRRVFTVVGAPGGSTRGGHVAGCRELVVLVTGRAELRVRRDGILEHHELATPGHGIHIGPDDHIDYDLDGPTSVIVVLCDRAYEARP